MSSSIYYRLNMSLSLVYSIPVEFCPNFANTVSKNEINITPHPRICPPSGSVF